MLSVAFKPSIIDNDIEGAVFLISTNLCLRYTELRSPRVVVSYTELRSPRVVVRYTELRSPRVVVKYTELRIPSRGRTHRVIMHGT